MFLYYFYVIAAIGHSLNSRIDHLALDTETGMSSCVQILMNYYLAGMNALVEAGAVRELVQLLGSCQTNQDVEYIWFLSYLLESVIASDAGSAALLATRMVEGGGLEHIVGQLHDSNPKVPSA